MKKKFASITASVLVFCAAAGFAAAYLPENFTDRGIYFKTSESTFADISGELGTNSDDISGFSESENEAASQTESVGLSEKSAADTISETQTASPAQTAPAATTAPSVTSAPSTSVPATTPAPATSAPATSASASTTRPAATTAAQTSAPASNLTFEQRVAELVNEERAKYGLSPLTLSTELSNVARIKSLDMHDNNYFSHTSPTFGSTFDLLKEKGISYRAAGENIAMGYQTPEAVMDGWMNSSGHRANILSENFAQIGVGYVANGNYWTQVFIG